jgi:hypothetical protein
MRIGIEYLAPLPFGTDTGVYTEGRYLLQLARMFAFYGCLVDIICEGNISTEGNIRFVSEAEEEYDVYLVQGWAAPKKNPVKSKMYLCCMFFPEHMLSAYTHITTYLLSTFFYPRPIL